jgi:hypothetical protein
VAGYDLFAFYADTLKDYCFAPASIMQTKTTYLTGVACECCQRTIPLFCASRPEKLHGLQWWYSDNQPLNFLCDSCTHVYGYRSAAIQSKTFLEMSDHHGLRKHLAIFYTEIGCGEEDCVSPARIHVLANQRRDGTKLLEDVEFFQNLVFVAVPKMVFCPSGHALSARAFRASVPRGPWFVADVCNCD